MKELLEKEAEEKLIKQGFMVPKHVIVRFEEELTSHAKDLKFPWAMKVISPRIVHKKRMGGVFVDIKNIQEANAAFQQLERLEGCTGVMVQEMVKGEELILGIKHTQEFGKVIMLGKGGSHAEEEKDVSFRVLPIKKSDAERMLKELRCHAHMKKHASPSLIIKYLLKLASLADKLKIHEMDINPLIVSKSKAWVVDARMVVDA